MKTLLVMGLLLAQAVADDVQVRSVTVTVTDDQANPIEGLVTEEVALLENGVVRDVTSLKLDRRPLSVVLLVDTSEAVADAYRLHMVDAIMGFLRRLPDGAKYSIWTTGDRPTKLVDFTDDPAAAGKALTRVVPQGGSTLLDALTEATRDLKKREGDRTAVVAVSAMGPEFSSRDRFRAIEDAQKNADVFLAVQLEEGRADYETRANYDHVLAGLPQKTGGLHERTLSPMGLDSALRKVSAYLRSSYRLSYATVPDLKNRKIEVKVARPGVKVRVSPEAVVARES
jgi:VWFA-related protein